MCDASHSWACDGRARVLWNAATQIGFIMAMSVQDTATPFGELSHTASQNAPGVNDATALFNGAIEALLADHTTLERVSQARGCLEKLQRLKGQISEELVSDLRHIVDDLDQRIIEGADYLSSDDEQELTERLFTLYLDVSDGMLIW
jgi:hypothetical protein